MSGIGKVVPLMLVLAIVMIFATYTYGVLSANGDQLNVTGTGYENAYNTNVAIQSATGTLFTPIAILIGIVALIVVLKGLSKGF